MKKIIFKIIIVSFLVIIFACKTTSVALLDNTFQATVVNNSPFVVEANGKTIKKDVSLKNTFPLYESDLYDGWDVDYVIPVSKDVLYLHKGKVQVTNNQNIVVIEPPSKDNIREAYIVVKNISKQTMQITNGLGTIFPCFIEGRINTQNVKKEHNISPSKVAVYEILKEDDMKRGRVFASQGNKNYSVLEHTVLKHGYVYTYEFNGKEVIKTDERPLLKVGEPLWKIEDETLIIEKVIAKENSYYASGRSKVLDENGNSYYCPYICCMDRETGNVQWKIKEKILEGSINDAIILDNGDILTIGQSIVERSNVGAIWLYSPKGVLLNNKKCPECLSLNAISLNNNENATLVGFDDEEISFLSLSLSKLQYKSFPIQLPQKDSINSTIPFYNKHSKTLFLFCNLVDEGGRSLSSKLYELKEDGKVKEVSLQEKISSISSVVQTSSGTLYVGGETSRSEKSEALILKIDGENLEALYQDTRAFSYISSLHLNEETQELIMSGVCKAKESSGMGGSPFISSLDIKTGKEVWRQDYRGMKYQLLRSFVPCLDYGFIASFSSILPSGEDYGSSILLRLTSSGKTILGDK